MSTTTVNSIVLLDLLVYRFHFILKWKYW